MSNTWWIGWVAAAALVGIAAGCQNNGEPRPARGEIFPPEGETRDVQNISITQAAAGARADATLRGVDFDGASLNSLGEQKLDLMLADEKPANPLALYLDLPANTASAPARESVVAYLKGRGLTESQLRIEDGPNPRSMSSSADGIRGFQALHSAAPAGTAPGADAPTAPADATAQPGYSGASH